MSKEAEVDYARLYERRISKDWREDYKIRLASLAEKLTDGNLIYAALIVESWRNGYADANDNFTSGTIGALVRYEEIADKIGLVRDYLESKTLFGHCDEFDATELTVFKRLPDGTVYYGDSTLWIKVTPEHFSVTSDMKSVGKIHYNYTELEDFCDDYIRPNLKKLRSDGG